MTRFLEDLSRSDIEAKAEAVLQRSSSLQGEAVDIERLIEVDFDLTLFIGSPAEIGQPSSVLGAIFFESKEIFANELLLGAEGRFRFTLAHELGHWVLHQNLIDPIEFAWPYVPGKSPRTQQILCRTQDSSPIERQANYFAAALLMPRWMFSQRVHSLAEHLHLTRSSSGYVVTNDDFENLVYRLSKAFAVSKEAARYRLSEMSLVSIGSPGQLQLLL